MGTLLDILILVLLWSCSYVAGKTLVSDDPVDFSLDYTLFAIEIAINAICVGLMLLGILAIVSLALSFML